MVLSNPLAALFVPDGCAFPMAWSRVTHLGIGAHHDDLEFMAYHGILQCYDHQDEKWFGGVVCTDGGGSARGGIHGALSLPELRARRSGEQRAAAMVGRYAAVAELGHLSNALRGVAGQSLLREDLRKILEASAPEVVYTHNPADKHDTHISVVLAVVAAIRSLPQPSRPRVLLGCEVWRDLDWMCDDDKVRLDVGGRDHLAAALTGIFDSQIAGGKRYDLAVMGRRAANATFGEPRDSDEASQVIFAMDLTPLIESDQLTPADYVLGLIDRFRSDVATRVARDH